MIHIDSDMKSKMEADKDGAVNSSDTNVLITSKKPRNSKKKEKPAQSKLSKRKRKKLELILARRMKKANRSSVLEKLHGLPQLELGSLRSITTLGERPKKKKDWAKPSDSTKDHVESESDSSGSEFSLADMKVENSGNEMPMSEQCLANFNDANDQPAVEKLKNDISLKRDDNEDLEPLPFPTGPEVVTGLKRVQVVRSKEVNRTRSGLPIISEEHNVLEAVSTNTVCIVCGATGSGKTTQVPQFLYEAGYCQNGIIGVTEPRRVAAVSMSQRVAKELNLPTSVVSYSIRFETNCTPDTKIKFMTDGVLLREAQQDFLLEKYSVLILDEAHERSEFTDILIGLVSRIAPLRKKRNLKPLKIVIMSATLRTQDFTDNKLLFKKPPPIVKVEARQHPVTAHFQKKTPAENEYLKEAYKRTCKLHRTLPKGGILVFVTSKSEINLLTKWLESTFPRTALKVAKDDFATSNKDADFVGTEQSTAPKRLKLEHYGAEAEKDEVTNFENDEVSNESERTSMDFKDINQGKADQQCPLFVLPLHSLLSSEEQALVFKQPPVGSRLCVIATNVAETSLTIPNIAYVIDTGKEKRKVYDTVTGISTFVVDWIPKSSAEQRAGRAGRTRAGHCYRLYSSAVYSEFADYGKPEILCRPVDDLVLMLKSLGFTRVVNFPFPNAPSSQAVLSAEKHLYHLGALKKCNTVKGEISYAITDLGVTMTKFGILPRFAKMLALSNQPKVGSGRGENMLAYTIAIVSALSVREIFQLSINDGKNEEESKSRKSENRFIRDTLMKWQGSSQVNGLGDIIVLLNVIIEFEKFRGNESWCKKHGLRHKAMLEIRRLRIDLTRIVNSVLPADEALSTKNLNLDEIKTKEDADMLRQIILSGLGDRIARRVHSDDHLIQEQNLKDLGIAEKTDDSKTEKKLKMGKNAYQATNIEGFVYIHPHSVLALELPEWIAFQDIQESSKVYAKDSIAIEESWLPHLFPTYCTFSDPLENPPPFYDAESDVIKCQMSCTYANNAWPIKSQEYKHPVNLKYYKLFAMFLLQGKVFQFFEQFLDRLVSPPSVINKPWSNLQERTESLVNALINRNCYSKAKLKEVWKGEPSYLMKEFLQWVPTDSCFSVQANWPPEQ